ncbi:Na+/melibiose symporter-like transporter [Sphaerochaeta pleomorpha str. Grapes]|uniref:Na+/melibiose symporter-like transporter n=1 Tax=Sphaerochaeta pleomorpha (strain ATCC BAA-1885 / DSM 22778 / Grapes) TaxID=158190 RepID=G8QTR1_SPHPG|nr:MFS transporter [Sphaerochaeta pleomorpha]AEV28026.1 Na+/melibiose symporter-like transporter [Sphaerochaeta pleomorpha str. Grapes]
METQKTIETLPFSKKILFALGQLGWSLASYAPGMLLVYFYMPPETGSSTVFPQRIYQGAILGIFTIIGLAFGVGRLFDAITDPLIAGLSDRCNSKKGKRQKFLRLGIIPFSLFSALIFVPPVSGYSVLNSVWVFVGVIVYYWFMTMYVTPYFAMMSELAHTADDRLFLSTLISITWALGAAIGSQVYAIKGVLENFSLSSTQAFQVTIFIFSGIGFLFMLFPILFINEKKYSKQEPNTEKIFESLVSALKNRNFLMFTISDLAYWVALTIASTGLVYYVTILLGLKESFTSFLQILMFALSFLFYVPVTILAKKTGKKRLLNLAFLLFILIYSFIIFLGRVPLNHELQAYLVVIMMAIPLAVFGILPNAIIGDIAQSDAFETGHHKAAIFYGARTFMSKLGQMVGGLLFPSLLLLGNTPGHDIGIRLTGLAAIIFVVVGLVFFLTYDEKAILKVLKAQAEKE